MADIKVTLDFSKVFLNREGTPTKDMIDPPDGRTPENAPDLTYGSFLSNALTLGIAKESPKEALRFYQMAMKIEEALKSSNGTLDYDEGELSQLEQALQKVSVPQFTLVFYLGPIQQMINDAKVELLAKQKAK